MAKAPTGLGLAKIGAPGQPKQVRVSLEPALAAELDQYVEAYAASYGERVDLDALIPHMLHSFVSADRGFKKWKADAAKGGTAE